MAGHYEDPVAPANESQMELRRKWLKLLKSHPHGTSTGRLVQPCEGFGSHMAYDPLGLAFLALEVKPEKRGEIWGFAFNGKFHTKVLAPEFKSLMNLVPSPHLLAGGEVTSIAGFADCGNTHADVAQHLEPLLMNPDYTGTKKSVRLLTNTPEPSASDPNTPDVASHAAA